MGLFDAIGSVVGGITGGNILSAGASIFSGLMGAESAADTNAASLNAQKELRDTQYQAAVKDMQAAGLNPMLATKLGGNMASSVPQLTPPASAGIQSALNSAQVVKTYADAKASEATAANQKANADVTEALGAIKVQSEIDNLRSSSQSSLSQADVNRKSLDLMNYQMDKIFSETSLNMQQQDFVRKQAANAVLTGEQIKANTGNTVVDTALKKAQAALYDVNTQLGKQEINFNVLDLPRRTKESSMHESAYGSFVPYFNSAGKAVDTLSKGIQLLPK
jgi:hypothetical protein